MSGLVCSTVRADSRVHSADSVHARNVILILNYVEHQTVGDSIDAIVEQADKTLEDLDIPSVTKICYKGLKVLKFLYINAEQ